MSAGWHIADAVLARSEVRYASNFSAASYLDGRPESAQTSPLTLALADVGFPPF
jgi:hypothetical protein